MTTSLAKDALLANFATLAYREPEQLEVPGALPDGWVKVKQEVDDATGFAAYAFRNTTTGEVVIAYRGTDGVNDVTGPDVAILGGNWHPQFNQAMTFAKQVTGDLKIVPEQVDPRTVINVTGHSLGGAEAQIVSQA